MAHALRIRWRLGAKRSAAWPITSRNYSFGGRFILHFEDGSGDVAAGYYLQWRERSCPATLIELISRDELPQDGGDFDERFVTQIGFGWSLNWRLHRGAAHFPQCFSRTGLRHVDGYRRPQPRHRRLQLRLCLRVSLPELDGQFQHGDRF